MRRTLNQPLTLVLALLILSAVSFYNAIHTGI